MLNYNIFGAGRMLLRSDEERSVGERPHGNPCKTRVGRAGKTIHDNAILYYIDE